MVRISDKDMLEPGFYFGPSMFYVFLLDSFGKSTTESQRVVAQVQKWLCPVNVTASPSSISNITFALLEDFSCECNSQDFTSRVHRV